MQQRHVREGRGAGRGLGPGRRRVYLGNLLDARDFDYQTAEEVRDELAGTLGDIEPDNSYAGKSAINKVNGADDRDAQIDIPIYSSDAIVRRATALQLTPEARRVAGGSG